MDQKNRQRQYSGTKGLSLAVVVGIAIGTVIGKLMDKMNTGLMIGLLLGICGWVLLFNRRQPRQPDTAAEVGCAADQSDTDNGETPPRV